MSTKTQQPTGARATLKDIAAYAGVSPIAVSRVLRGEKHESQETCVKIRAAAEKLGYRPNAMARAVRNGSFGAIGLLRSAEPVAAIITPAMLWALERELLHLDLPLVIGQLPDEKLTNPKMMPRLLREWSVDGLLINYTAHAPEKMISLLSEFHLPSVWLNIRLRYNCVFPEERAAMRATTEKLLSLGHRRIAFLGVPPTPNSHFSVRDRQEEFLRVMSSANATPQLVLCDENADLLQVSGELLKHRDRPTAIITCGRREATVVIVAASRLGLELPRDLSLIVVRDENDLIGGIDVTTSFIPVFGLAACAVSMLLRRIVNPQIEEPAQGVSFHEHVGATCAPPKKR